MSRLLLLAQICCLVSSTYLPGIDVSTYQGDIDWAAVASSGVKFVSIKATEGTTFLDPHLARNWAGAREHGLFRTAYHFAHPSLDAVAQANFFVASVNAAGGFGKNTSTMQLMLDLEDADKEAPAAVWAWTQAFLGRVQALTGRPGIVYTGYYFWRDQVGNPSSNLDCPLWIAAYIPKPLVPSAWPGGWTFWQHSDAGKIPGITGNVDLDYFAGSVAQLEKLCF